jgi:hypothetical protein
MSEQIEEWVENLKRPSLWRRVFFTLGFALLFNIILVPLVLLMILVQVAFAVFTGEKNNNLLEISEKVVAYIVEVLGFLLFTTEHRPFPFNDFPSPGNVDMRSHSGEDKEQAETDERTSQIEESKSPDSGLDDDSTPSRGPNATPQG